MKPKHIDTIRNTDDNTNLSNQLYLGLYLGTQFKSESQLHIEFLLHKLFNIIIHFT